MIRRRHGWQHFRLEWPDGTEIGRVKANWNGGTKALTVSSRSYTVKRVGINRRGGALADAAAGRLVGRWREAGIKHKHDRDILLESARQHPDFVPGMLGPEPWIIGETERTLWPGFAFEDGEVSIFRVDGRLRSATPRFFDPQRNVVVTIGSCLHGRGSMTAHRLVCNAARPSSPCPAQPT